MPLIQSPIRDRTPKSSPSSRPRSILAQAWGPAVPARRHVNSHFRDFYVLVPEMAPAADRPDVARPVGAVVRRWSSAVSLLTLVAAVAAVAPLLVRFDDTGADRFAGYLRQEPRPGPALRHDLGRHAHRDVQPVATLLLALVVWMSMAWSFTENWGEYFALMFWSTVGMMLLTASEELLTLFLTLETMTICLYLCTAFEKNRRRSAEAGLKYFVYGSVSSALFLFGLSLLYGLTGSTRFDAIWHAVLAVPRRRQRPDGQRGGGDGGPADAGRVRVQGGGRAVPPVGARRLRGAPAPRSPPGSRPGRRSPASWP